MWFLCLLTLPKPFQLFLFQCLPRLQDKWMTLAFCQDEWNFVGMVAHQKSWWCLASWIKAKSSIFETGIPKRILWEISNCNSAPSERNYRHFLIYTLILGTHKKHGEQKPRKSRLLSSTKGEENRIELSTLFNPKLRKLKPRILRNACPCFRILMTIHLLTIL